MSLNALRGWWSHCVLANLSARVPRLMNFVRQLVLGLVCVALGPSLTASAEDKEEKKDDGTSPIASVELSKTGPDKTFPIDRPFYLTGTAAKVKDETPERVALVIVRRWWGPWGLPPSGRAPRSCGDVERAIADRDLRVSGLASSKPNVADLWTSSTGGSIEARKHFTWLSRNARVHTAVGPVADGKFKIFIDAGTFLHETGKYCVFAYGLAKPSVTAIRDEILQAMVKRYAACEKPDSSDCRIAVVDATQKALTRLLDENDVGPEPRKDLKNLVNTVVASQLFGMIESQADVADLAKKKCDNCDLVQLGLLDSDRTWDISTPLGQYVAEAIRAKVPGIRRDPAAANAGYAFEYTVEVAKLKVKTIHFEVAGTDALVTKLTLVDAAGKTHVLKTSDGKKDLKLADIPVPGTSVGVSMEDLRQFLGGRLKYSSRYKPLRDQIKDDDGALNGLNRLKSEDGLLKLIRAHGGVTAMSSVTEGFENIYEPTKQSAPTDPAVQALKKVIANLGPPIAHVDELSQKLKNLTNQLGLLAGNLDGLVPKARAEISAKYALAPNISPTLSVSERGYFDSFVTGFQGVAFGAYENGQAMVVPYAGAQVFFWPNPVSEPMWSNGRDDLRRIVGIEYGVKETTGNFGPGERYSGLIPGKLPMMFVGGVFQLIPYTVVSGGASFATYRRSTLPTEQAQFRASWYVGAAVDLNFLGFIRERMGRTKEAEAKPEG